MEVIRRKDEDRKPLKNIKSGGFLEYYVLGKYLGEGAHARVFMCENKLSASRYAVKILEKKLLSKEMIYRYIKEITLVHNLLNPYIIHISEYFED